MFWELNMANKIRLSVSQPGFQPPSQLLETNFCPIHLLGQQPIPGSSTSTQGPQNWVVLYSHLIGALGTLQLAKAI